MAREKKEKSKTRKIIEGIGLGVFVALIGFVSVILITSTVKKFSNKKNPYEPTNIAGVYFPLIVRTDSMEPDYMTKSAIFIKKQSYTAIIEDFNNGKNVDLTFDDNYTTTFTYTPEDLAALEANGKNEIGRTTLDQAMRTMTHRLFYVRINEDKEVGQGKYMFFVAGINLSEHQSQSNQFQVFTENELYGRVIGTSRFVGWCFTAAESPIGLIVLLLIPSLYMVVSSIVDLAKVSKEEQLEAETIDGQIVNETEVSEKTENNDPLAGLSDEDRKRLKEEMLNQMLNKEDE